MRKFFWSRETEAESAAISKFTGAASLSERIASGPLPLGEALRYAIATAEALREVHARGRVYSLLQPACVSIRNGGLQLVPVVQSAITPYHSPEQLQGRDLDLRSDIFSLGAILYEMLSGRKAFPAPSKPALRFAILDADPSPLENVPPAISQLVMRCLEKKPERRVQRMEILLAQLKLQAILTSPDQAAAAST
jgi:serine/threonine protein kinase